MEENTGNVLLIKPATLVAESKAKLGGTLQVATLQLRWDPMHSSDHQPVSVQLSSVTGVLQRSKKSPMVRIPTRGGAVTLEFQSMPERDEVVDILTPLVKKVADKGKAPVGQPAQAAPQQAAPQLTGPPALVVLKSKLLKKDKDLRHLFDELVRNGIISEGEFWKQRVHLLREAQGPTGSAKQRTGISNALLSRGTDAKGQQNKVTFKLNAEGIQQIFAEQPHVHKAFLDNVPHNLTEAAFWDRYFKNEFRMRALRRKAKAGDKTAALELADEDELFRNRGDAAEQELQQRHKVRRVDPTVNLAADSFDRWSHGFGLEHDPAKPCMAIEHPKVEPPCALTLQDVDPSVVQEGVGKHLLSELNRHADVVLQGLPISVGTSANTEGLAQAMWEAQQVEAAAERNGRGNTDQHLTAEEQRAFRMRADGALGDLQAEDHQQFVELNIRDPRRYFEGKVAADGSQQAQVHGAPPAVLWQQALVSINLAQLQHGMTPQLTYQVMQDLYAEQTTMGLDETGLTVGTNPATDLAAPIQEECRRVCQTGNEMLRHFWASFPWTSKQREDKAAKLDRALASHYDRSAMLP
eukprot:jgi/Astpho2/4764/Aster-x0212